ncbi:hypothetical protein BH23BAC3_BH23BAC3_22650 [soil metagenome]
MYSSVLNGHSFVINGLFYFFNLDNNAKFIYISHFITFYKW